MAKKFGGEPNERMSNIMSGTRHRGAGEIRAGSTVRNESYVNNPVLGTSGPFKTRTLTAAPGKTSLQKTKNVPRTYASKSIPRALFDIVTKAPIKMPAVAAKPVAKKPVVAKPAAVVSNVTREKLSPAPAKAPASKAVSMRTGDTTGVTTGKTTGTVSRTPGMATKTKQSAYGRQMANAARNQPAGPMGGGGRGGSLGGGGASRTSSGGGNLGGARGRISEPGGSKR